MSSYYGRAVNPRNFNLENACFMDDFYGKHRYGIKFDDGSTYPEAHVVVQDPNNTGKFYYGGQSIQLEFDEEILQFTGTVTIGKNSASVVASTLTTALMDFVKCTNHIKNLQKRVFTK